MANKKKTDVYAPVKQANESYSELNIVEDGNDPINSAEEDAVAAFKGHIERQDGEGR